MQRAIEKIFVVGMLLYTTAAFSPFIDGLNDPLTRPEGNLIAIGVQVGLYSMALYFIATRWQAFLQGALTVKWVGLLLAVAMVSSAWSQDPALTLRRSALLLAT